MQPVVIAAAVLAAAAFRAHTSSALLVGVVLVSIVLPPWRAPLAEPARRGSARTDLGPEGG